MSKITLIHFVPGDHIALTPHAIMKHLGAQAIHDFGTNANPSPAAVRDLIRLSRRNKHVAVLTLGDNSVQETLNRLIKRDDLAIDVQHTSYALIAGQILHVEHLEKRIPHDLSELELRVIAMYGNPVTAAEIQLKVDEWRKQNPQLAFYGKCMSAEAIRAGVESGLLPGGAIDNVLHTSPTGRRKDTGENVEFPGSRIKLIAVDDDRIIKQFEGRQGRDVEAWPTPTYRFPHVPVDFEVPHKKAHVRGVAHGATMYAMGLVEGMAIGDRYITLIVNGDEDAKKIFIDYPFINWDSGRIQVRTVSEVLMVNAEDKAALGYAEWVADVTPENLKALLELDQWQHFVGFLSGDKFDRFTKDYSQ